MNKLEKIVAKRKLASALIEKLAGNPDLKGGMPSTTRPGYKVYPQRKAKRATMSKGGLPVMGGTGSSNRKALGRYGIKL
tara:strand:- start:806 stop:1042 length:237 start_codon:yes stop_codon:yes gene_type:complete